MPKTFNDLVASFETERFALPGARPMFSKGTYLAWNANPGVWNGKIVFRVEPRKRINKLKLRLYVSTAQMHQLKKVWQTIRFGEWDDSEGVVLMVDSAKDAMTTLKAMYDKYFRELRRYIFAPFNALLAWGT